MSDVSIPASIPAALPQLEAGWLARRLSRMLLSRIRIGTLTIITPNGMRLAHGGGNGPDGVMVLHRWRTLRRLLLQGDVAFGEAFMDGDWESPDLPALIELAGRNMPTLTDAIDGNWHKRLRNRLMHRLNANTRRGSRRNIARHYDLGNDFYRCWLDAGMSYSSALYVSPDMSLEDAQTAKQDRVVMLLDVQGGEHVLEIGCGWGGLAEKLVKEAGCLVTGVTLSPSQLAFATQRLADAVPEVAPGAAPCAATRKVSDLRLQDYRDVEGQFDRIVSIEMMEAVGAAYWPSYFNTLRERLKPGGVAVIQVISIADNLFEGYKRCPDFIQRHIFPGGMLPTISEIGRQTRQAGLVLRSADMFGQSYARTLAEWRRRFHAAWPEIQKQGFDQRFRRMWDYYLAYCEGGFRARNINVGIYVMGRPA